MRLTLLLLLLAASPLALAADEPSPEDRAKALAAGVMSADAETRVRFRRDLLNNVYSDLTDEQRVAAILPMLATINTDHAARDGLMETTIQHLPRLAGSEGKQILPSLLKLLGDAKTDSLRYSLIIAVTKIGPEDPAVVAALVASMERTPDDRGAEEIGRMGSVAAPAKAVLLKKVAIPSVNAYLALGKIAFAESPRKDFFPRLSAADASVEERSAAMAQIASIAKPSAEQLKSFREALRVILESQPQPAEKEGAALTLAKIGAGSDPRMIRAIFGAMQATPNGGFEAAMASVDATDKAAVPGLGELFDANTAEPAQVKAIVLVKLIGRYGSLAEPLTPNVFAVYRKAVVHPSWIPGEYLMTLAKIAPGNVEVQATVVELLDPASPANQDSNHQLKMQGFAYQTLNVLGVPTDPALADATIKRLVGDFVTQPKLMVSALTFLEKADGGLLRRNKAELLPPLLALLKQDVEMKEFRQDMTTASTVLRSQISAVRILAAMRGDAADALPQLREIAQREPMQPGYNAVYGPWNQLIATAKAAVETIR